MCPMTGSTAARRAHLAADPDAELLGAVVAAVTSIDSSAITGPGVTIKGIVVQCLGVQHKLAAFWA
jgi:hypothetical protein